MVNALSAAMPAPMYIGAQATAPSAFGAPRRDYGFGSTPGSLRDMIIDSMFDQQTPTSFNTSHFTPSSIKSDTGDRLPGFEASFCQGYTCCGLQLDDLHHLLEHFEENHVTDLPINSPRSPQQAIQDLKRRAKGIVLQAQATPPATVAALPSVAGLSDYRTTPAPQPSLSAHPTPVAPSHLPPIDPNAVPRSPAPSSASSVASPSTPAGASFDMDDVSMDTDEASESESSAFGAFSSAAGRSRTKKRNYASALGHLRGTLDNLNLAAAANAQRSSASASSSRSGSVCASPQLPNVDDTDSEGMDTDDAGPGSSTSSLAAVSGGGLPPSLFFPARRSTSPPENNNPNGIPTINVPGLPADFVPPLPTLPSGRQWVPPANKPFKCPVPGCDKAYKQQNGLKYHRLHGHCNNRAGGATGKEAEGRETLEAKPYGCYVGAACGKRYKNMNGLRYHYMHSGEHGTIGLAMLASSTHPPPLLPAQRAVQSSAASSRSASPASAKMPQLPLGIVST